MMSAGVDQPWSAFSPQRRWVMLGVMVLIGTTSAMDRSILTLLLEPIKHEYGLSDRDIGFLSGAPFALCYAAAAIPFGRLADRGNRKLLLILALVFWSVMTALCGLATTLPLLVLARMGVGVGEGCASPTSVALITDMFPPERRSTAFAIWMASAITGGLLALVVGSALMARYDWHAAFIGLALISLPVVICATFILREPPRGVRTLGHKGAGFVADLRHLLSKRSFSLLIVAATIYAMFAYGPYTFVPTYMLRILKVDVADMGSLYGIPSTIGAIIGTVGGGLIADPLARRDPRWLLWWPALGMGVALPVALVMLSTDSIEVFVVAVVLLIASLSAVIPALFAAIQHVCGVDRRATAAAIFLATLNALGMTLGPLATGELSDLLVPQYGPLSLRYAMLGMSLVLLPAVMCLWLGARHLTRDREV